MFTVLLFSTLSSHRIHHSHNFCLSGVVLGDDIAQHILESSQFVFTTASAIHHTSIFNASYDACLFDAADCIHRDSLIYLVDQCKNANVPIAIFASTSLISSSPDKLPREFAECHNLVTSHRNIKFDPLPLVDSNLSHSVLLESFDTQDCFPESSDKCGGHIINTK